MVRSSLSAESAAGLVHAARILAEVGRRGSVPPLLSAALARKTDAPTLRAILGTAEATGDVEAALQAFTALEKGYAARGTDRAEVLAALRARSVAALALARGVPFAMSAPTADPVPGRLIYLLHYALPQVSNGYATRGHGLAAAMVAAGMDVVCLTRPGFPANVRPDLAGPAFPAEDRVGDVRYLHDPAPVHKGTSNLAAYVREASGVIGRRIAEVRPQVLMAASNHANALPGLIAARRAGIPFWYEVRGFWEETGRSNIEGYETTFAYALARAVETAVMQAADRVFTLTAAMRADMIARGVEADRIALLPNATDPERFTPQPRDGTLAARLGIPDGVPVIGYAGTFIRYEGLDDLVRACGRLAARGRDFRLLLVGNERASGNERGTITEEIEKIARDCAITDRLILPGRVPHDEVAAWYSLIDVAPFPRKPLPVAELVSPLKPLEAMAMEKAVVVSSVAPLAEMVRDGETGLVFAKGNPGSLADTLDRALTEPALRTRLGRQARAWVRAERTWARMAGKVAGAVADLSPPAVATLRARGFGDATRLLYADIDLNTVDGSAIWMAAMAEILAHDGRVVVLSKNPIRREVVVARPRDNPDVTILEPADCGLGDGRMDVATAMDLLRGIDDALPSIEAVVVRGLAAVRAAFSDRQFRHRLYPYLTDLYDHGPDGITPRAGLAEALDPIVRQSAALLVQTPQIEAFLRTLTDVPFRALPLPPPVPDALLHPARPEAATPIQMQERTVRIGYAGKIAPAWGVDVLLDWAARLRSDGHAVEVHIIGDKISGAGDAAANRAFRADMLARMDAAGAIRHGALDRAATRAKMAEMDFAWCWRPGSFEDHTLELSTKLIESLVAGQPCIAWPGPVNRDALGPDYPGFVRDYEGFARLVAARPVPRPDRELQARLRKRHALSEIAAQLSPQLSAAGQAERQDPVPAQPRRMPLLCVAGHDLKFIDAYISDRKRRGLPTVTDRWQWGEPQNIVRSIKATQDADVILCEWGLANAVWYARHLLSGPRLVVRLHAQEIRARAQKFGKALNAGRVDRFLFVSDRVRRTAVTMFGWSEEKTATIPNFLLDDEFLAVDRASPRDRRPVRLGMVGIVPQSKRFDRAVEVLRALRYRGLDAELHIKGHKPADLPFMRAPGRAAELAWYDEVQARTDADPDLRRRVVHHPWGNDVARFYAGIDHILSPSENESFHYALADGVLSGCHPVVWNWDGAEDVYPTDWVVPDVAAAAERIVAAESLLAPERAALAEERRALLIDRYGHKRIFAALDAVLAGR